MVIMGVIVSFLFILIGLTIKLWFWMIPSARKLRELADKYEKEAVSETASGDRASASTRMFMHEHSKLVNCIRIIDRRETALEQIEDVNFHFIVFVFVFLCLLFPSFVKASERMHSMNMRTTSQHSTEVHSINENGTLANKSLPNQTENGTLANKSLPNQTDVLPGAQRHNLGDPPADTTSISEEIMLVLEETWMAPYVETVFFFMAMYAAALLLREFGKIQRRAGE
jgi:Na+-transporting methylmalonyl-CoA/oxaloacetate decarboxylase gamma subunit